jgi:hypothetical protein
VGQPLGRCSAQGEAEMALHIMEAARATGVRGGDVGQGFA